MKQYILFFISLAAFTGQINGQTDTTTVYKDLETKKFYSVSISATTKNGQIQYEVNGQKVSKSTYDKYYSTWNNMVSCCPCILKTYNENEVLIRESVSCTDCGVGVFKEFYPNGTIKLSGRYKENPTGNWVNIYERGFCSVRDGQWVYYNEKGDTLYSEFWNNGEFVKQVPEQKTNEIWKIELRLNGESVENKTLTPDQVRQLEIIPKFKNSAKSTNNFLIKFEVSAVGHKAKEKSFTMANFKHIDVLKMLSEAGIPSDKKANFILSFFDNEKLIRRFYLNIKH